jgi:N utilization substance protein A
VSIVDDRDRVMEVIVEDKQLSLAIGKKGQNVRLAAKLTGWRIDIKSEEEKRREVEAQFEGLEASVDSTESTAESTETTSGSVETTEGSAASTEASQAEEGGTPAVEEETPLPYALAGIGEKTVRKLVDAGFTTPEEVAAATVEQISALPGIGEKTAEKILAAARGEQTEGSADL